MTVIATRLSTRVERGFSAVVQFMTRVVELRNGRERRNGMWVMPRRKYTARMAGFDAAAIAELVNVVHACMGQLYAFLFRDWNDYSVTNESLGTAPAGSTPVQLTKAYTYGTQTHTRNITKPVASTVTVYQDNGSGVFVAKPGTLDDTTGLFTPTTSWTAGRAIRWTGEFLVPVRFASDDIEFVLPDRNIREVTLELIEVIGE